MTFLAERLGSKIPVFSVIISSIVAWLVVPPITGFPMIAFFLFFVSVGTLVYILRKQKTKFDTLLYCGILLLSCFTIYRANDFLQFLDFIFIIFFGSLLINPLNRDHSVFDLVASPLVVMRNSLLAKNIFPYSFTRPTRTTHGHYLREYLPTIAITGLILAITIPLLASANPFFNAYLQNILNVFDLDWLFKILFADAMSVYVFRLVALTFLMYFIPRVLTVSTRDTGKLEVTPFFAINYLIPKIAMAILLIIFFITQLQLYLASAETLRSMGYTNSRLTNEVFAQVTIVAFIVGLLAYLDKKKQTWNTRLTYFLTVEAFFLIAIAFKSVYDYTALWGFTQKRLWGYTSMTWLTGTLLAFIYHYWKKTPELHFFKQMLSYTLAILLLVNSMNFDYLIYHTAKASTSAGVDYEYLAGLSPDGHYYKDALPKIMAEVEKMTQMDYAKTNPAYEILGNIDALRYKYGSQRDINSFNISEYQAYLDTTDVDVQGYRNRLSEIQQKLTPTQTPLPAPTLMITPGIN